MLTVLEHICDFQPNQNKLVKDRQRQLLEKAKICCCPKPFIECNETAAGNQQCKKILAEHISGVNAGGENAGKYDEADVMQTTEDETLVKRINVDDGDGDGREKNIRNVVYSKSTSDVKTTITASTTTTKNLFQTTLNVINSIRHQLINLDDNNDSAKTCTKYLSPATLQSPVECNHKNIPPFQRQDHQCEQLYWTHEELGVDNEGEMKDAGCPFKKSYRGVLSVDRILSDEESEDKDMVGNADGDEEKIKNNDIEKPEGMATFFIN